MATARAPNTSGLGTPLLNSSFWNPTLLARDLATTDVRIGAGHMNWEFDEAGIDWQPFDSRVREMRETIDELAHLFASHGYEQQAELRAEHGTSVLQPVHNHGFAGTGPPLIVGGTGDQVLRHAAGNGRHLSSPGCASASRDWVSVNTDGIAVINISDRET